MVAVYAFALTQFCVFLGEKIDIDNKKRRWQMMKRQGDILIVRVSNIPLDAKSRKSRVLAEGEATGHLHELDYGEVYEKDGVLYFRVSEKPSILLHPEHKAITFEPGAYKVIQQREYEPSGWKRVRD